MTKRHRRPRENPSINLLTAVDGSTYIKLITLAATLGVGRLELYRQAITWAINQEQFIVDMAKVYKGDPKKAKS